MVGVFFPRILNWIYKNSRIIKKTKLEIQNTIYFFEQNPFLSFQYCHLEDGKCFERIIRLGTEDILVSIGGRENLKFKTKIQICFEIDWNAFIEQEVNKGRK